MQFFPNLAKIAIVGDMLELGDIEEKMNIKKLENFTFVLKNSVKHLYLWIQIAKVT